METQGNEHKVTLKKMDMKQKCILLKKKTEKHKMLRKQETNGIKKIT